MKSTGRAAVELVDQALSSLTNFALAIVVVRSVSRQDFGAFSIVFSAYLLSAGLGRAVASSPLAIRYSGTGERQLVGAVQRSAGTALALGVAVACVMCVVALLCPAILRTPLLVLAAATPGLLLQDCWRYSFVVQGRPASAVINDGVWTLLQFLGFASLLVTGHGSTASLLAVWGAAGTGAGLVGIAQAGAVPLPLRWRSWFLDHRRLALPLSVEAILLLGANQLSLIAVSAIVGLADAGSMRAAATLFSPLSSLFVGALFVAVPEAVRLRGIRPTRVRRLIAVVSAATTGVTAFWTAIAVAVALAGGRRLLGDSTAGARSLFTPTALQFAGSAAGVGPQVGLRAFAAANTILLCQVQYAAMLLVASVAGAAIGGIQGAAYGGAFATLSNAGIWWLSVSRRGRSAEVHEADDVR